MAKCYPGTFVFKFRNPAFHYFADYIRWPVAGGTKGCPARSPGKNYIKFPLSLSSFPALPILFSARISSFSLLLIRALSRHDTPTSPSCLSPFFPFLPFPLTTFPQLDVHVNKLVVFVLYLGVLMRTGSAEKTLRWNQLKNCSNLTQK